MTWAQPNYRAIALRIEAGDSDAETELVRRFERGLRLLAMRQLGDSADADDIVHEVLMITIENLRTGKLVDPDRLTGYVHAIFKNVVRHTIELRVRSRSAQSADPGTEHFELTDTSLSPEQLVQRAERQQFVERVLASLNPRDREILRRFYLTEETPAQICSAMRLTETQFRLLKSRAKTKVAEVARRSIRRPVRAQHSVRELISARSA